MRTFVVKGNLCFSRSMDELVCMEQAVILSSKTAASRASSGRCRSDTRSCRCWIMASS
ncbi:MAG: hypothetical protein ACLU3I_13505 [Acutalibacteraceae bacterium]